jgi:transposase-like protein
MTNGAVEVITSVQRRRRWSAEEKRRIVAAAIEPGAVASEVARAARIYPSQLFRWRSALRDCPPSRREAAGQPRLTLQSGMLSPTRRTARTQETVRSLVEGDLISLDAGKTRAVRLRAPHHQRAHEEPHW